MPSLLSTNVHFRTRSYLDKNISGHRIVGTKCFRPKKIELRHLPRCVKASLGSGDDDFRTLMRFIRLQSAIRNRSIKEFVELFGDECKYFCASIPAIDPLRLIKKVLEFLLLVMIRNNVMFVIKPSADHSVDFGIRWILAWTENNLPIGFGINLCTSHFYEGTVLIKKANTILEPLLQIKNLPLKLEEIMLPLIDRIVPKGMLEGGRKVTFMYCLLSLIVMAISYVLLKSKFV